VKPNHTTARKPGPLLIIQYSLLQNIDRSLMQLPYSVKNVFILGTLGCTSASVWTRRTTTSSTWRPFTTS
jgi:hypothetical protein